MQSKYYVHPPSGFTYRFRHWRRVKPFGVSAQGPIERPKEDATVSRTRSGGCG